MSPILKRVVYPWLANSGYLRRRAGGGSFCVITYHGILPEGYEISDPQQDGSLVTAQSFREQLRLLKECYRVVTPQQVHDWLVEGKPLPELAVLLTCDDGLCGTLTDMVPILLEEEVSCLFFVLGASASNQRHTLWYEDLYRILLAASSGRYSLKGPQVNNSEEIDGLVSIKLGDRQQRRSLWWNLVKKLSTYSHASRMDFIAAVGTELGVDSNRILKSGDESSRLRRFSLLNASELRELANLGMTVGAHTLHHPILSMQDSEIAWQEISESRTLLEKAVGKSIWAMAYPFGDTASVGSREMQMAEQAGFECAFMNIGGGFGAQLPRFALPRVHVTTQMSLSEFEAHVSGFYRDFRSRLSRDSA